MSSIKTPKKIAAIGSQSSKTITMLLDQSFFIFAGLASFWLAWLVFREGLATGGWWLVGLFFVVWAIVSYLALPRLHRILSNMYVPNYFIGRTRTADGILSDPINLSVRGSEEKLHKAMTAAGSYDKSVGLSLFTFQLTHKIDENIDIERDYIIESVKKSEKYIRVAVLKDFSTGYHSRNGSGDLIRTDGDLPILEVGRIRIDKPIATLKRFGIIMDGTIHDRCPRNHETLLEELWSRRPPQILIGSVLMVLASLFAVGQTLVDISSWPEILAVVTNIEQIDINLANTALSIMAVLNVLLVIVEFILVGLLLRGSNRARISLLAVAMLAIITESLSVTTGRINASAILLLTSIGVHIMIMMLFSSDAARYFTERR